MRAVPSLLLIAAAAACSTGNSRRRNNLPLAADMAEQAPSPDLIAPAAPSGSDLGLPDAPPDLATSADLITSVPFEPSGPCTGFATTAASWGVPDTKYGATASAGAASWQVVDLNGDGRLDLVETKYSGADEAYVGGSGPYWRFYAGGTTGFSPTYVQWPVPDKKFFRTEGAAWTLADLDGDGRPELLEVMGSSAILYLNSGVGFSTGVTSGLPSSRYVTPSGDGWAILDLDGDGIADLVDTHATGSTEPYTSGIDSVWRLYRGSSIGLATTPTTVRVPSKRYATLVSTDPSVGLWSTFDLDGDGKPELVETKFMNANEAYVGANGPYWRAYRQNATGFPDTYTQWKVPLKDFYAAAGAGGTRGWGLVDLDGDGKPDLVETAASGALPSGGWRVYFGITDGFVPTATSWSVPVADAIALAGDRWSVVDFDGNGCRELVVSGSGNGLSFGSTGSAYWSRY